MKRVFATNISDLYGKELIAFGTGDVGKKIIPILAQDPNIKLRGVTNSRITVDDAGTFQDTDLPLRSLQTWAKFSPKATILVTVRRAELIEEIHTACYNAGFSDILLISNYLITKTYQASLNYALMQGIGSSMEKFEPMLYTMSPFLNLLCLANEIQDLHKATFSAFKACHRGRSVVVTGTGPSLNYYSQIKNIPHIGINASVLKKELKLDYYFAGHYNPEWFEALEHNNCVKFYGKSSVNDASKYDCIPEDIVEKTNGRRFYGSALSEFINIDIEHYPLMGSGSTIFPAIHFALYTRPKCILLVGCDCSSKGHFYDEDEASLRAIEYVYEGNLPTVIRGYEKLKDFVDKYYPETEIVSVNPVGLKGMFHDVYTESYLDAHPALERAQCEILDPASFEGK